MTDLFTAQGKKKRAKAFVTLQVISDNPASWVIHSSSLQAYIKRHTYLHEELNKLITKNLVMKCLETFNTFAF